MVLHTSCQNNEGNMERFVDTVKNAINKQQIVHQCLSEKLQSLLPLSLKYMDTHRDRQVAKALIAEVSSVNFTAKLQGLQSRKGTSSAKKSVHTQLEQYQEIRKMSQIVRK